jgi:hypothetical protein
LGIQSLRCRGWAGPELKNGELLALTEKEFEVLITVDRQLSQQQNLSRFSIAVLLVRARTNRLEDIRPLVPDILQAVERTSAGALTVVGS